MDARRLGCEISGLGGGNDFRSEMSLNALAYRSGSGVRV